MKKNCIIFFLLSIFIFITYIIFGPRPGQSHNSNIIPICFTPLINNTNYLDANSLIPSYHDPNNVFTLVNICEMIYTANNILIEMANLRTENVLKYPINNLGNSLNNTITYVSNKNLYCRN